MPTKTFRTNVPPDIMGPRASRPSAGTRPYRLRNGNDSGRLLPRTQKHPAAAPGPLQGSNERTQATAPPPPTPTASRTSPSPRSSAPLSPPIPPCRASRPSPHSADLYTNHRAMRSPPPPPQPLHPHRTNGGRPAAPTSSGAAPASSPPAQAASAAGVLIDSDLALCGRVAGA